jgi:hypothetical protein
MDADLPLGERYIDTRLTKCGADADADAAAQPEVLVLIGPEKEQEVEGAVAKSLEHSSGLGFAYTSA